MGLRTKAIAGHPSRGYISKQGRAVLRDETARSFYFNNSLATYRELLSFKKDHLQRMIGGMDSRNLAPDDLIGQNTVLYLQMLLRRSLRLLMGCLLSVRNKNHLSAILNVRAHFEVTGAIGYLLENLVKYYSKEMRKEEIGGPFKEIDTRSTARSKSKTIRSNERSHHDRTRRQAARQPTP